MKVKIIKCIGEGYWYKERIGEVFNVNNLLENSYEVTVNGIPVGKFITKYDCEILEELNVEPFELKEGMKFKVVSKDPEHINFVEEMEVFLDKILTVKKRLQSGYKVKENTWFFNNEFIDWEETKKLNSEKIHKEEQNVEKEKEKADEIFKKVRDFLNEETKETPKAETKIEEEPKSKGYMIINPKDEVPKKIHATLIDAELEVKRLLSIQSNHEFIIVEIIERAKAETKVVWF